MTREPSSHISSGASDRGASQTDPVSQQRADTREKDRYPLSSGWWIVPAAVLGAAVWGGLIWWLLA